MRYFSLLIIVVLFGCNQPEKKSFTSKPKTSDSVAIKRIAKRAQAEKEWRLDSLKDEAIVNDVLAYVKTKRLIKADTTLRLWKDTSISAHIKIGNLFSAKVKHLVIRCHVSWKIIIYVYGLDNLQRSVREIRDDWSDLAYLGDAIKDISGDGINDFVINWYPPAGCCARNNYHVYLYQKSGAFSGYFDFINPSFFPKERIVRGVDYGHPGEVPLYKYKWNGSSIDTIEYIYPADTFKKKFYLVHHYGDENNAKKRTLLKVVPKEYKKIYGFDWFIDY